MRTPLSICEERVRFRGETGKLEGRFAYPVEPDPTWSALIAGPHPLLGGDLGNNVVKALLEGFASAGAAVLSFNYGGVGESKGGPADWPAAVSTFWEKGWFGEERFWVEDAAAALAAVRMWCDRPLLLVGYSFGCWTAARVVACSDARGLLLISPNPKQHDFAALSEADIPLRVLHSDNDFTCTPEELIGWFDSLREPKSRELLRSSEHFFRGQETDVVRSALSFCRHALGQEVTQL